MDPSSNRLSRGDEVAQLEPRLLGLLTELAAHQGRVRTRAQLTQAVWHTEFISDNSLTHAVAELRSLLGDDARQPRYIETIPKKGYRLAAPVELEAPETVASGAAAAGPHSAARRWGIAAICLIVTLLPVGWMTGTLRAPTAGDRSTIPRIVVLPFDNLGRPEDHYFADGITEEITSRLSSLHGLQVISRTSATTYAATGKTVAEIGAELEVDFVLEGSVRWERGGTTPDRVRITPQLIRVRDDAHLWSASFERTIDQVFAVQSEIGQHVTEQLDLTLLESEKHAVSRQTSQNLSAYQAYLQGGAFLYSGEQSDLEQAISFFNRAAALEPGFGLAHARLALSHAYMNNFGYDDDGSHAMAARRAIAHAEAVAASQPEVRRIHATLRYYLDHDLEGALDDYREVLEGLPNSSEALAGMAYVERRLGRWTQAQNHLEHALELDPMNPSHLWNLAINLMLFHRYEEADEVLERAISISPGMRVPHLYRVCNLMLWDGTGTRARAALAAAPGPHDARWLREAYAVEMVDRRFKNAFDLMRSCTPDELAPGTRAVLLCRSASRLGEPATASQVCSEGLRLLEAEVGAQPDCPYARMNLAEILAELGEPELARIRALEAIDIMQQRRDAVELSRMRLRLARIHSASRQPEPAAALLETLLSTPSGVSVASVSHHPDWDAVRDHPQVQRLLTKL